MTASSSPDNSDANPGRHVPTVDEALVLIEQERLDNIANLEPGEPADLVEGAPEVLASEVRRLRVALAARRPFSDKLAQEVIDGQVKEIDRLTKMVQEERAARTPSAMASTAPGLRVALEECEKLRQGVIYDDGFDPGILSRMKYMLEKKLSDSATPPEVGFTKRNVAAWLRGIATEDDDLYDDQRFWLREAASALDGLATVQSPGPGETR